MSAGGSLDSPGQSKHDTSCDDGCRIDLLRTTVDRDRATEERSEHGSGHVERKSGTRRKSRMGREHRRKPPEIVLTGFRNIHPHDGVHVELESSTRLNRNRPNVSTENTPQCPDAKPIECHVARSRRGRSPLDRRHGFFIGAALEAQSQRWGPPASTEIAKRSDQAPPRRGRDSAPNVEAEHHLAMG